MPYLILQPSRAGTRKKVAAQSPHAPLSRPATATTALHPLPQAKLRIGAPNDQYEREADHVAAQVTRMPGPMPAAPSITDDLNVRSGGGPLPESVCGFFEPRFGRDLSRVRLHTDTKAAQSANSINALAYTVGHDIVFGPRQFAPATANGRNLLAHELTHVLQQSPAAPRASVHTTRDPVTTVHRKPIEPRATNYAFDTYRVTAVHLQDPGIVARLNALNEEQLSAYRERVTDPEVIMFINDILGQRAYEKRAVARQVVANYAKAERAGTHCPQGACYSVARGRVEQAARQTTGASLTTGLEQETIGAFDRLWGVHIHPREEWLNLPEEYRAKGSAGAMAFIGKGRLVDQAGIWSGQLEPGAVIQTWHDAADFERVKNGDAPGDYGHSFIFIDYVRDAQGAITGMKIADQGYQSHRTLTQADYGFWVGANILIATPPKFVTPRTRYQGF